MIPFAPVFKNVLQSKEWKQLTHSEQIIYIRIKANYSGSNNGNIPFKYSDVTGKEPGCFSPATVSKALKGLIAKGWIKKTRYGGLYRAYCLYALTLNFDQVLGSKPRHKKRTAYG